VGGSPQKIGAAYSAREEGIVFGGGGNYSKRGSKRRKEILYPQKLPVNFPGMKARKKERSSSIGVFSKKRFQLKI